MRLSDRANEWMTGIGVWKDPTRDHRKNVDPWKRGLSLRQLKVGICRRTDFVIVFLDPNPNWPPTLISRHNHFFSYWLVETSHPCRLFHSYPFLLLLGSFVRLVRSLALADSLFCLFTGSFRAVFSSPFPFSSAICTVSSLTTTASLFRSRFLVGIGTRNGQGRSFAAYW